MERMYTARMRAILLVGIGAIVVAGGWYYASTRSASIEQPIRETMATSSPVEIIPIEHATAVIRWGDAIFYTDPVGGTQAFANQPSPQIILLTDIHGDHLSVGTLESVSGTATFIAPQAVKDELPEALARRTKVLANGHALTERGFTILAIPMYNLPESPDAKHVKGRGNGYIVEKDGFRLYVAGDTAGTPEMRALRNIDIALVPMNLPYTMGIEEAASAVLDFKPKTVYPYHYRGPDGLADVEQFKRLVGEGNPDIEVVLAQWYPNQ
jgi:L-ascorbate metabolism protein UlaG (beta-lactamase superfamily)